MSDEVFAEHIKPYSLTDEQKEALMRCKEVIIEMALTIQEVLSKVIDSVIKAFNELSEKLDSLCDKIQEELDKIQPPTKKPYLSIVMRSKSYTTRRIFLGASTVFKTDKEKLNEKR